MAENIVRFKGRGPGDPGHTRGQVSITTPYATAWTNLQSLPPAFIGRNPYNAMQLPEAQILEVPGDYRGYVAVRSEVIVHETGVTSEDDDVSSGEVDFLSAAGTITVFGRVPRGEISVFAGGSNRGDRGTQVSNDAWVRLVESYTNEESVVLSPEAVNYRADYTANSLTMDGFTPAVAVSGGFELGNTPAGVNAVVSVSEEVLFDLRGCDQVIVVPSAPATPAVGYTIEQARLRARLISGV